MSVLEEFFDIVIGNFRNKRIQKTYTYCLCGPWKVQYLLQAWTKQI